MPISLKLGNEIDYHISICKKFEYNPYSGEIFAFKSDASTQLGMLSYDEHGFHWCIKRFSEGKITWWPKVKRGVQIEVRDFQILLWGGNPQTVEMPKMWK